MNSTQHPCELSTLSTELSTFKLTDGIFAGLLTICVINGVLSVVATFTNILVITTIASFPELKTNSNTLLLFLAVTDLLVGLVVQPSFITFLAGKIQLNFNCKAMVTYLFTEIFCVGLSLLTLCVVNIERYFSIFHPFWYESHVTRSSLIAVTSLVWGVWTVFNVVCRALKVKNDEFFAPAGALIIGCALILNVAIYAKVYGVIRAHEKRIVAQKRQANLLELQIAGSNSSTKRSTGATHRHIRETRMTRTVGYLMGILILCYSPLMLTSLIELMTSNDDMFDHFIYPLAETITFMNSALNPFLYYWRCHDIRRKIKGMAGCHKRSILPTCCG